MKNFLRAIPAALTLACDPHGLPDAETGDSETGTSPTTEAWADPDAKACLDEAKAVVSTGIKILYSADSIKNLTPDGTSITSAVEITEPKNGAVYRDLEMIVLDVSSDEARFADVHEIDLTSEEAAAFQTAGVVLGGNLLNVNFEPNLNATGGYQFYGVNRVDGECRAVSAVFECDQISTEGQYDGCTDAGSSVAVSNE